MRLNHTPINQKEKFIFLLTILDFLKNLCFQGNSAVKSQALEELKSLLLLTPKKKASIYLYTCSYALKPLSLGLGDLQRDQLNSEPRTLLVTNKRYKHFHGKNIF